ncbi:unnamed protein product [Brassica rapa]|uniref:Uncharacterized protein n=2 Tax=Brassica campestris TaxID=3711 RepID=A0A8D9HEL5_BRACM|nr:unnamed protein product [Brassica rapa]
MEISELLSLFGVLPELSWKYILFKRKSFRVSQKTMNAHEAEADAEQAVSKVEAAMTAAEESAKEADAAEAARAYAEEASKTLKGKKNICKLVNTLFLYHTTHDKEKYFFMVVLKI